MVSKPHYSSEGSHSLQMRNVKTAVASKGEGKTKRRWVHENDFESGYGVGVGLRCRLHDIDAHALSTVSPGRRKSIRCTVPASDGAPRRRSIAEDRCVRRSGPLERSIIDMSRESSSVVKHTEKVTQAT